MSQVRIKFHGNLVPGSDDARNYLCVLPGDLGTLHDDAGEVLKGLVDACRKLVPSMLPPCPDPSHPRCGIRYTAGGGERVVPKGAIANIDEEQAKFLLQTAPRGLLEVLGAASGDGGGDAVLAARVAQLDGINRDLEARLGLAEREVESLKQSVKAEQNNSAIAREAVEELKLAGVHHAQALADAQAHEKTLTAKLAVALDKSLAPPLQKRIEELEREYADLVAKTAKTSKKD